MKTAIFSLTSVGDFAPMRGRWSSALAVSRRASSRSSFRLFSVKKFSSAAAARSCGINFPQPQPLAQFLGGQINVHDLVGLQHKPVGHALAHVHARRAQHGVVQAFEMLDVHRGDDVDAGQQQIMHFEIALGMLRAGDVRERQFVHDANRRVAFENGVNVENFDRACRRAGLFCAE